MKYHTLFLFEKMSQNLSSAAVVIGGLRVNKLSFSSMLDVFIVVWTLNIDTKKAIEYDQETPQSHTTYQVINPRHHEEELHNTDSHKTIKVKQPALSFPS